MTAGAINVLSALSLYLIASSVVISAFQFGVKKPLDFNELKPGEYGLPFEINATSEEDIDLQEDLYELYGYNHFASAQISIHRSLPDFRDPQKAEHFYSPKTQTSIIITFYNEALITFLRTINSIINRSPQHLVKEIILVDDFSDLEDLKEPLERRLRNIEKVKIIRAPKRLGLIKARLLALKYASAPIITFLDAHVECTQGWLEPLISRIEENPSVVATPVVDWIQPHTLEYIVRSSSAPDIGGFTWDLFFDWLPISKERMDKMKRNPTAPIPSPTNVGGIFAINRTFFEKLGYYDEQLEIWGGENIELSFKAWMCGGSIEYIPCSRVGHIYKSHKTYGTSLLEKYLKRNLLRVAEVWMDDYKYFFHSMLFHELEDFGSVSTRIELRKQLSCHSFEWYLDNVIPEMFNPKRMALKGGEIRNMGFAEDHCLEIPKSAMSASEVSKTSEAFAFQCHRLGSKQHIWYTRTHELRNGPKCLDFDGAEVTVKDCHGMQGNQMFVYDEYSDTFIHGPTSMCLEMEKMSNNGKKFSLSVKKCEEDNLFQQWEYESFIPENE